MEMMIKLNSELDKKYPEQLRQIVKQAKAIEGKYGEIAKAQGKSNQQIKEQSRLMTELDRLKNLSQQQEVYKQNKERQPKNREEYRKVSEKARDLGTKKVQQEKLTAELKLKLENEKAIYEKVKQEVSKAKAEIESLKNLKNNATNESLKQQYSSELKARREQLKSLQSEYKEAKGNYGSTSNAYSAELNNLKAMSAELSKVQSQARSLNQELSASRIANQQIESNFKSNGYSLNSNQIHQDYQRAQSYQQSQSTYQSARSVMSEKGANLSDAKSNFDSAVDMAKGIMSPFTSATAKAMEFEHAMSKVKALTQAKDIQLGNTAKVESEMKELTNLAKKLGQTTQFTAAQAAGAMGYLGQAGWGKSQIVGGMESLLNLSAAAGTELPRTADIISDNMTAIGLEAGKLIKVGKNQNRMVEASKHFADVYAYAMSNSNVTLESMGETFKYAAPIANAYGATLEDVAAMTMIMGNAGVKGSQAGTSLRMGLLRLSGPPKKASKEMEALGISMSDAMKMANETQMMLDHLGIKTDENAAPVDKMNQVIRQLSVKMKDLTGEEQLAAVSAIFGANAATGWVNILKAGPDAFQNYRDSLRECDGYVKQMSLTMNDDAVGATIAMDSAIDGVSLALGAIFLPIVKVGATIIAGIMAKFSEWIEEHQVLAQWLGIIAAGLSALIILIAMCGLAFAVWGFISSTIATISAGISFLIATFKGLTVVQWIATAATYAFSAAMTIFNAIASLNPVAIIVIAIIALIGIIYLAISQIEGLKEALMNAWNDPQGAIHGFCELIKGKINEAVEYVVQRWNTLKEALSHPLEAVMNFMDHGDVIGGSIGKEYQAQAPQVQQVQQTPVESQALAESTQAVTTSMQNLAPTTQAMSESMSTIAPNTQTFSESMSNLAPNMTTMSESMSMVTPNLTTSNEQLTQASTNLTASNEQLTMTNTNLTSMNEQMSLTSTSLTSLNEAISLVSAGFSALQGSFEGLMSAISACASALSAKASEISSIHISIPTVTSAPISHNAKGGIYPKGEFLTTFAERSAEAAIPLDGSNRAISLWQEVGSMLGISPSLQANFEASSDTLNLEQPLEDVNYSSGGTNINYQAPNITIKGNATENAIEKIREVLKESESEFERRVLSVIRRESERKERVSYV